MSDDIDNLSFVVGFPLPFRVLCLVGLGILGWATNLHGLSLFGIDAASTLDLHTTHAGLGTPITDHRQHSGFKFIEDPWIYYAPVYRLSALYASFCFLAWVLYHSATHTNPAYADPFKFIPAICALCVLIAVLTPQNIIEKRERDAFLLSIRRCLFSPLISPIFLSDVIFADVFTSFAKVLGDVWLSICMLLPGGSLLALPPQDGWSRWILPALMSLPYLVRLRQCLIEYAHPSNISRRPLFNALKYASSFPVIFLSAAQRLVVSELVAAKGDQATHEAWHGEHPLFRLWLLAALVNSLYSFWWDVTNDWGFDLLRPNMSPKKPARPQSLPRPLVLPTLHERLESLTSVSGLLTTNSVAHSPHPTSSVPHLRSTYPYGLRPTLLLPLPVYPFIIFLNLILRLTWGIKLSSHLHAHMQGDGSAFIFWIEIAEIVRRWAWVFVRIEWEIVKRAQGGGSGKGGKIRDGLDPDADDREDSYEMVFDSTRGEAVDP